MKFKLNTISSEKMYYVLKYMHHNGQSHKINWSYLEKYGHVYYQSDLDDLEDLGDFSWEESESRIYLDDRFYPEELIAVSYQNDILFYLNCRRVGDDYGVTTSRYSIDISYVALANLDSDDDLEVFKQDCVEEILEFIDDNNDDDVNCRLNENELIDYISSQVDDLYEAIKMQEQGE